MIRGVTKDTYSKLAQAFIRAADNKGFVIGLELGRHVEQATPRQWGAWRAYFRRLGMKTRLMDQLGYYTVPAEWPHMFDAEATVQGDHAAAQAFEAERERQKRRFNADAAGNRAARSNNIWPQIRRERFAPTPAEHLRKKTPAEEAFEKMDPTEFTDREEEKPFRAVAQKAAA